MFVNNNQFKSIIAIPKVVSRQCMIDIMLCNSAIFRCKVNKNYLIFTIKCLIKAFVGKNFNYFVEWLLVF